MMEIQEFLEKIKRHISSLYGDEYEVKTQEMCKNNDTVRYGLIIREKSRKIAPTIYMEDFYTSYENGMTMEDIIQEIVTLYRKHTPKKDVDMDFFQDYDQVKNRICFKLINKSKNKKLLSDIPNMDFLDLAICFFYSYNDSELGEGNILIHNCHMKLWDVQISELYECAMKNTPVIYPYKLTDMGEMIKTIYEKEGKLQEFRQDEECYSKCDMKILTNQTNVLGAACLLYKDILNEISNSYESNFYVIPSSIHELIILPKSEETSHETILSIISEVNETQLQNEEILSDHLYEYDKQCNSLRIL